MKVILTADQLQEIEAHGEGSYPNEGAGFMLGKIASGEVQITTLLTLDNQREEEAQHNRYELSPKDFMQAELQAAKQGLDLVGVFHSHPDHPAVPSEFDREYAWPHFSYIISSIEGGKATITRAWRLKEDRSAFDEDTLTTHN